jgi:hypothetical protein
MGQAQRAALVAVSIRWCSLRKPHGNQRKHVPHVKTAHLLTQMRDWPGTEALLGCCNKMKNA